MGVGQEAFRDVEPITRLGNLFVYSGTFDIRPLKGQDSRIERRFRSMDLSLISKRGSRCSRSRLPSISERFLLHLNSETNTLNSASVMQL